MTRLRIQSCIALAAGLVLGGVAHAASPDEAFIKKAAAGGMAEVQLGKLAQDKGGDQKVKEFGERMVKDHSAANDELKQIASSKGVSLPGQMDPESQKTYDRLQKMDGAQFDRSYISDMVSDHHKDIAAFENEAKNGKDADVKAFARKTLPTLKEHLRMAESDHKSVK